MSTAQLYIGQRIYDNREARDILIGIASGQELVDWPIAAVTGNELSYALWDNEPGLLRFIKYRGNAVPVKIGALCGLAASLLGSEHISWPKARSEANTDAIVGFALTTRFEMAVLDHGQPVLPHGGRPDPFEFEPQEIVDILNQVRIWWPEAKAILWG